MIFSKLLLQNADIIWFILVHFFLSSDHQRPGPSLTFQMYMSKTSKHKCFLWRLEFKFRIQKIPYHYTSGSKLCNFFFCKWDVMCVSVFRDLMRLTVTGDAGYRSVTINHKMLEQIHTFF